MAKSLRDEVEGEAHDEALRAWQGKVARLEKQLAGEQARLRQAERIIDSLQERIERQREGWKVTASKVKPKGGFVRLVIPDTHGAHADKAAIGAMLGDLESLKPKEAIWLGDHLDCGGFLAQHHTLGYVAETSVTFEQDVEATNALLDAVGACGASQVYLEGNHEQRIERWCVTMALRSGADSAFLLKRMGPVAVLGLEKRGIPYIREAEYHDGLSVRGTIKRGGCHFTHGMYHGKDAARKHLAAFGANIVFGHIHRECSASDETVTQGQIRAWCPGALCTRRPYWHHTRPSGWTQGYGFQLVRSDGDFLHVNVPIIDGKSYLGPLAERLL